MSTASGRVPVRREPPSFRRVRVQTVEDLSLRMRRFVLGGPELEGLVIDEPAASVRVLFPPSRSAGLVMPAWTGNLFEFADGTRAPIRTFTPRYFDPAAATLTIDVVAHRSGIASDWASTASIGDELAISGPARGHEIDTSSAGYLLAGDESAVPAISQLLEQMPDEMPVQVMIEISTPEAQIDLPSHPSSEARWLEAAVGAEPGSAMVAAITELDELPPAVWVAGEAAAVQKIRKHLFDERGMSRSAATVRGYWKHGR